ncbi:insect cuticle protein [Holotrichia oblita]|uniref:Insect cuticle protein n=1 Tax=Holotrichia oblita TaxID=644536 RepID=A0ACB9TTR9_HOLOL|nr:insect cuticle protein [Holotrichia oblita]
MEQIKTNFPEALPLLEEDMEEGRIEYVKTKTETILSKGSKGETSRVLYMLPYAIDPEGINDLHKLYDTIGQLKEAMAEQNTEKVKLVALGNLDSDYMRKCAEHIYRGSTNKIEIVTNKQISSGKKETQQLEKMVIRSEGKQYADILRTIKSSVDIDEVGIKIKSIKKTTKGDVMLEIQGGADKAEALKRGILNKSQGTRVEMKSKEETDVTGIDGDVDRQEIENALRKNVLIAFFVATCTFASPIKDEAVVDVIQDTEGYYKYTFTSKNITREEERTHDGLVKGYYSFLDDNGDRQTIHYTAGDNGFAAEGSSIPVDLPEVAEARKQHEVISEKIRSLLPALKSDYLVDEVPEIPLTKEEFLHAVSEALHPSLNVGVPDSPEVEAAKGEFFKSFEKALA